MHETDVTTFICDLDGGVFEQKLGHILSEVAGAVVDHGDRGKAGQVQITLDIKRLGQGAQVEVKHKLSYSRPTMHGKSSEEEQLMTPMYVGVGGKMSLFPEGQDQLFTKHGEVSHDAE
jgi:hypothetical protein